MNQWINDQLVLIGRPKLARRTQMESRNLADIAMKTNLSLSLGLTVFGLLGLVAAPAAVGGGLQMIVVAEQPDARAPAAAASPDHPVYYVAFDGGYIEAGDPIAGERPPGAAAMAKALQHTLAGLGYQPAAGAATPTLVLTYHWGLINRDSFATKIGTKIDPNMHARLSLVTTSHQDGEIENYLLDKRMLGRTNPAFRSPGILSIRERDALELAHDNRYFVVLSAYDYSSISQRQPKLVWRVKLSTLSVGVSMADALPTLLQGGAPYMGRNLTDFEYAKVPLVAAVGGGPGGEVDRFSPPLGNTGSLDGQFLRGLMKPEHDEFSGTHAYEKTPYEPVVASVSASAASSMQVVQPK